MKRKGRKGEWDDGMILNLEVSSSDEELEEIQEDEEALHEIQEDNEGLEEIQEDDEELDGVQEEDGELEEIHEKEEKPSRQGVLNTEVNPGKRKAEVPEGGNISKKRKGKHKVAVRSHDMYKDADEEEDINNAVRKLLAGDSQFVTDEWQMGANKSDDKSTGKRKKSGLHNGVDDEQQKRRGLEGWGNPKEVDESDSFASLGIDDALSACLSEMGYRTPWKVQRSMVPGFLTGRDLLVGSGAGTGKTLGYLVPMIHQLQTQEPRISRGEGTFGIILGASTESCSAIGDLTTALMTRCCWWLTCGVLVGSKNRGHEKARLRKGITVVVTTDTRLLDHLENTSAFKTQELRWFVVDEAGHHLQSKRGNRLRCAVRLLEARAQDSDLLEGRQQNILTTSSMDAELGSLAVWMLKRPLCVGLRPRLGKRFWDVVSVSGWGVKPFVPDPDMQNGNVYNQRYKN